MMGMVYCGAYAEQVGYGHEGYAARVLPDGSLTGAWTLETNDFVGYVAACACGWLSDIQHPPTDEGENEAEDEWDQDHLRPLIATAAEQWPNWARRVHSWATEIVAHIDADRPDLAVLLFEQLSADVQTWARIAAELAEEAEARREAMR